MNVSLFQAAAALNANARWQEVISENMASSSVPGYKKRELSLAAVQAGLIPPGSVHTANSPQFFSLPKATTTTSFRPGELRLTGNKNDLAIEGTGFFEVRLPNGTMALTRDGEFQITAQGQLVTKQGYAIMGDSGPIQLDTSNHEPVSISGTGEVSQGADLKGKIKLVDYAKPQLLTQISGAYFIADNPNLRPQPSVASLRQGYLESANTSPVAEMVNMMAAMRTFEANQRIVQIQDERMGRIISELGNPS